MDVKEKMNRRRRENPVKKWSESEIIMILDFIHETGNFEIITFNNTNHLLIPQKPTAQIYYRKCLDQKPLDTTWDLIRWKVRSLKTTFLKANEWQKSTGAGLLGTKEGVCSFKAKIQKLCPNYDRLKDIFGDKSEGGSSYHAYEIQDFLVCEDEQTDDVLGYEEIFTTTEMTEVLSLGSQVESHNNNRHELPQTTPTPAITPTPATTSTQTNSSFSESIKCAEKFHKFAPKTAIGQLTQLQYERQAFQEKTKIGKRKAASGS